MELKGIVRGAMARRLICIIISVGIFLLGCYILMIRSIVTLFGATLMIFSALFIFFATINMLWDFIFTFSKRRYKRYSIYRNMDFDYEVQSELLGNIETFGKYIFTKNWVVKKGIFSVFVINIEDIVWIYREREIIKVKFFIPIGKRYFLKCYMKDKSIVKIPIRKNDYEEVLDKILVRKYYGIVGFNKNIEKSFYKNKDEFIDYVINERRLMFVNK